MSDDIVLEMARALLVTAIETQHYRLLQEWDEDGAWYRLHRKNEPPNEGPVYRLDEGVALLLDSEADAFMEAVTVAQTGEQHPDDDGVLW